MVGMEQAIEETLVRPERVMTSFSDPQARLYYRFHPATLVGDKYLCVIVKVTAADAFVLTAYLTDRVRVGVGERQLYGTQLQWRNGELLPLETEYPEHLDRRRLAAGLEPMDEYTASARGMVPPSN